MTLTFTASARRFGIASALGTVVLSHLLFTLPFVLIVVYARLASFDFRIVESARDLGALLALLDRLDQASLAAQRRITLPFLRGLLRENGESTS